MWENPHPSLILDITEDIVVFNNMCHGHISWTFGTFPRVFYTYITYLVISEQVVQTNFSSLARRKI